MYEHARQELERRIEALYVKQQKFDGGIKALNAQQQKLEAMFETLNIWQQKLDDKLDTIKLETINVNEQPKLSIGSDALRSSLVEKGLEPGHIELLGGVIMQYIVARYTALELITAIVIDNNLTVKEFDVLNVCTKQFSINLNNIPSYIDLIRKYEVTSDKIELLGKTGFSFSDQVKTIADFEYIIDAISKHPITAEHCKFLKVYFPTFRDIKDFKDAIEVLSKHNLKEDQKIAELEVGLIESGTSIKGAKHLDILISNLEKYGSVIKPFGASFWEKLGYTYEAETSGARTFNKQLEDGRELVQPAHAEVKNEAFEV